jgi:hypothetical protein
MKIMFTDQDGCRCEVTPASMPSGTHVIASVLTWLQPAGADPVLVLSGAQFALPPLPGGLPLKPGDASRSGGPGTRRLTRWLRGSARSTG